MIKKLAVGALFTALVVPAVGSPANAEVVPPTEITIDVVTVNGSGCPIGSAAVAVSPDKKAFTVTYSAFELETTGPNTRVQKNCNIAIVVNQPPAFTYAIAKADYRGYKALMADGRAEFRGVYYFSGNSITQDRTDAISGGEGDWQITHEVPYTDLVYMPCGTKRQLNMNTRLIAFQGNGNADQVNFITMDSADLEISTQYTFSWLQC